MLNDYHARRVLVVLQNAYDKGELAKGYSYRRWLKEMERSRVGQRLECIFRSLWLPHYVNTTPLIGAGPNARLPVNLAHMRRAFNRVQPTLVMACGKQAESACAELWAGDLVAIPHPAYRVLTNLLLEEVSQIIGWRMTQLDCSDRAIPKRFYFASRDSTMRIAVRQQRGLMTIEPIA